MEKGPLSGQCIGASEFRLRYFWDVRGRNLRSSFSTSSHFSEDGSMQNSARSVTIRCLRMYDKNARTKCSSKRRRSRIVYVPISNTGHGIEMYLQYILFNLIYKIYFYYMYSMIKKKYACY